MAAPLLLLVLMDVVVVVLLLHVVVVVAVLGLVVVVLVLQKLVKNEWCLNAGREFFSPALSGASNYEVRYCLMLASCEPTDQFRKKRYRGVTFSFSGGTMDSLARGILGHNAHRTQSPVNYQKMLISEKYTEIVSTLVLF